MRPLTIAAAIPLCATASWRLRGLPGLILKATELYGIFSFEATWIEKAAGVLKPAGTHYARRTRKELAALLDDHSGDRRIFAMRRPGIVDLDDTKPLTPSETPSLLDPGK
ncbi:hypothetical protein NP234_24990 [Salmonella enterica]|nr:hypothetical protein [Salmonella enterica]